MFCQSCGAPLPINANFCPNCGIPVHGPVGPTPVGIVAPAIETCIINLRWQQGQGFVPGWFEADVSGPAGNYIAGTSATFSIIPGNDFWLNNDNVRQTHTALADQLTNEGWQHIGQASSDWWSTQFRRGL